MFGGVEVGTSQKQKFTIHNDAKSKIEVKLFINKTEPFFSFSDEDIEKYRSDM